ncbi:MAG: hypothetical protein KTR26_22160 [Flammeovirgaceae bacterium]|nr:hypothetical protein [Flammeovirgaceae bacterium]
MEETVDLDLSKTTGIYTLKWFNPRTREYTIKRLIRLLLQRKVKPIWRVY